MAYEEKAKMVQRPHNIILEGRTHLSVSGVEDVESFDENEIVMHTTKGNLIVQGEGLHIEKLSIDTGELTVTGMVTDLSYEEVSQGGSVWSRLFG
ncbi:MAG TPA: sporulation protein YabP [Clostridiales bacterium]|jgi:sporulation protein YabP|nr:sporulation protein YabP [Clostridiales bacterium]